MPNDYKYSSKIKLLLQAAASFTDWVLSWPEQAVLTSHAIAWSAGAEEAIRRMVHEEGGASTREFLRHCAAQLEEVVASVRKSDAEAKDVRTRDRKTLRSLIIVNVHAKYGSSSKFFSVSLLYCTV